MKKNIIQSFVLKVINILITLQVVPLTINYVNPTRYGIWLTLSSIIGWLNYFDFGFANGFRNRFAEARAKGDTKLAQEYVSTTYAALAILFSTTFAITLAVNKFLNWSELLNINATYDEELHIVFGLLSCFFCLNIVASVFTTMLTADQRPAMASLVQTIGQVFAFFCIYILTKTTAGSLTALAIAYSGVPCLLLIVVSVFLFSDKNYKEVSPSFRCIRISLTKNILGLGGQFFVITTSMLVIFQLINVIISRVEGPEAVTQYNIAYKYFNILNMVFIIILTPFWSAFTDAYVKKDIEWMRKTAKKLEILWLACIPILILMVGCSSALYRWWIGDTVSVPFSLSVSMAIYVLFFTGANVYMYMINGTSKVRLQLIVYLASALVAVPLMVYCCKRFGTEGILIVPTIVYAIQTLVGKMQIKRISNGTAKGIWLK